jgi:hypothetical protein
MITTGQLMDRLAGAFRVSGMVVSPLEEEATVTPRPTAICSGVVSLSKAKMSDL